LPIHALYATFCRSLTTCRRHKGGMATVVHVNVAPPE